MTVAKESPKPVPPYVPYRTFLTFTEGLRQGVPGRIDRSLMKSMSGIMQNQLLAALRYLQLIDAKGNTAEALSRIAASEGPDRKLALKGVLESAYRSVLNDLNLSTATSLQLNEKFKDAGASGDTVRRCVAFFLAGAKDSGLTVSPHIVASPTLRKAESKPKRDRSSGKSKGSSQQSEPEQQRTTQLGWTQMLLSKFPSFDPTWPDDVKNKWFDAFDRLMSYGENGGMPTNSA